MKALVIIIGCGVLGYVRGQINEATALQNTLNIIAFVPMLVLAFWTMPDLRKQTVTITICATLINFLAAWLVQQPEAGMTLVVGAMTILGFATGMFLVKRQWTISLAFIVPLLVALTMIYPNEPRVVQVGMYFFVFMLMTWLMEDEENDLINLAIKYVRQAVSNHLGYILCALALVLLLIAIAYPSLTILNARFEIQEMAKTRQTYALSDGWIADVWGKHVENHDITFEPDGWTKHALDLTSEGTFFKHDKIVVAVVDFQARAFRLDADEFLQKDDAIYWRNQYGTFALKVVMENEIWTTTKK